MSDARISCVELAERIAEKPSRVAEFLSEWREAGWVVRHRDDTWELTPRGFAVAAPTLDMLGPDEHREVKRYKSASARGRKTLGVPAAECCGQGCSRCMRKDAAA